MKFAEGNKERKVWFVVAIEQEFIAQNHNIAYTDVGKVNAAMTTQKLIDIYHPTKIINVGTAGARPGIPTGQIYPINIVADRDLNIPGRPPQMIVINTESCNVCHTGDTFVTEWGHNKYNIVDMEAYAIAAVCKANKVQFECYKYISDNGKDTDWEQSLGKCNQAFQQMFKERIKTCMKNSKTL